ncbi:MAG TPA: MFS transporter [Candidatus Limnocylindrales bacterium]|nr:MFS transporter [Candidatus Limnocylindrales bacterium]
MRIRSSDLWGNAAFVRFWTGRTISVFGSLVTRLALPFVAILALEAGPLEVAVLRSVDLAAALVVGLFAGVWVDRLRRRPILIWTDLLSAAVLASVPLAYLLGVLGLAQLLVVAAAAAVLATFADAADNAYQPSVVERPQLVRANGALEASGSAAEFAGFGLGGFLVQALTAPIAILVDAVSFLFSASLLISIRRPEADPPRREHRAPVLGEIREGLRITFRDSTLRAFAMAQMAQSAMWGVFGATWLLFATRDLQLGAGVIGLIAAVGGVASFAGAVAADRSTRRWGVGRVAVVAMLMAAAGNLLIPLAPAGLPLVAVLFLVGQQLIGDSAITLYDVTETSVRQSFVHDRALGRVASSFRVAAVTAQLAGTIAAGLLAEAIGLRAVLFMGPLGALLAAAALWFSPARGLVGLPTEPVHGPAATLAAVRESTRDEPIGG